MGLAAISYSSNPPPQIKSLFNLNSTSDDLIIMPRILPKLKRLTNTPSDEIVKNAIIRSTRLIYQMARLSNQQIGSVYNRLNFDLNTDIANEAELRGNLAMEKIAFNGTMTNIRYIIETTENLGAELLQQTESRLKTISNGNVATVSLTNAMDGIRNWLKHNFSKINKSWTILMNYLQELFKWTDSEVNKFFKGVKTKNEVMASLMKSLNSIQKANITTDEANLRSFQIKTIAYIRQKNTFNKVIQL